MQVFELKGELRSDLGKKATAALRAQGKVPCVLYGGQENVHFAVVEKDLQKLLFILLSCTLLVKNMRQ